MNEILKLNLKLYINSKKQKEFDRSSLLKVAIGNFDGLHLGHRYIIQKIISSRNGIKSLIITFSSHNHSIFSTEQKIESLFDLGVDYVVVLPENIREMNFGDFVQFLKSFNIDLIVVGSGFRFGSERQGSASDLEKEFSVFAAPFVRSTDTEIISSTRIRSLIRLTDTINATSLLGYTPFIQGDLIEGVHQAHKQGFPTINIKYQGTIYDRGVYIGKVFIAKSSYKNNKLDTEFSIDIDGRVHISIDEYLLYPHTKNSGYLSQESFYNALIHVGSRPTLKKIHPFYYAYDTKVCEAHVVDSRFNEQELLKKDGTQFAKFFILKHISKEKEFSNEKDLIEAINFYKRALLKFFRKD